MKKILLLIVFSLLFTQDISPPYYLNHPIYGPGISLNTPSEIEIQNSLASFQIGFWISTMEWDIGLDPNESEMLSDWFSENNTDGMTAILDDGSGVHKYGLRLISPSGNLYEAFAQPGFMFDYTSSGNWGDYIVNACCECGFELGMCVSYGLDLLVPSSVLELGIYEVSFVVADYAGNEMIINGDELESLGGSSTLNITGANNLDTSPPYYLNHPTYGPSIEINIPNEIVIENSIASFNIGFSSADWVNFQESWEWFEIMNFNQQSLIIDDESGVKKFGLRLTSPSGIVNDAFIQQDWDLTSYEVSGNWGDFISDGFGECESSGGMCAYFDFNINIPQTEISFGLYEASFIFIDNAGNELVISGDELENLGASSTINFNESNSIDDSPPLYIIHPDYGPAVQLYTPNEIEIQNSVASFDAGFGSQEWFYDSWEWLENQNYGENIFYDEGSGIHKFGIRMISPSGIINEAFIEPGFDFDYSSSGNWSQYINSAMGECSDFFGYCTNYGFSLIIPANDLELGTYLTNFVLIDYAGNELVIQGNEMETLGANSTATFFSNENTTVIDIFDNYAILTWDWGNGDNIIINESALDIFDQGDTLYFYDNNALISNNCNDSELNGPAILDYHPFTYNNQLFNLYANKGIDECINFNFRVPGYEDGSLMLFSYFDNSNDAIYELSPNYSSGNGLFGIPFDDTLTFKYYDIENNLVYNLNETIPFESDMIIGNAIDYFEFTIDLNSSTSEIPIWEFEYNIYENNGSISCSVENGNIGDKIVAMVGDEIRGVSESVLSPFNTVVFNLMTHSNPSSTSISSFEIGSELRSNSYSFLNQNQNNRGGYKYNVYKNGLLHLENYNEQYYLDYDLDENVCYEIYLIDNYNDSEFLTSNELCFYLEENQYPAGDINLDNNVNVSDVVLLINYILSNDSYPAGDINQDGNVNVTDAVLLINMILNS